MEAKLWSCSDHWFALLVVALARDLAVAVLAAPLVGVRATRPGVSGWQNTPQILRTAGTIVLSFFSFSVIVY